MFGGSGTSSIPAPWGATGPNGLLIEGARTNLCLQSNALTTTWAASGTPAATQNAIGPDGGTTAWTLTDNDAGSTEYIYQNIVFTAADYTLSFFVKKTTGAQSSYPVAFWYTSTTNLAAVTVDTSNGVATAWTAWTGFTGVGGTATCVSHNADYWRVSLTHTKTVTSYTLALAPAGTTNATQSTGVPDTAAQGSAVFYGAQVELGSFASSYIATTTIAVARAADVATTPSAGIIDGTVGSAYAEIFFPVVTGTQYIIMTDTIPVGSGPLYTNSANLHLIDASTQIAASPALNVSASTATKVASRWSGVTASFAKNGTVSAGASAFDGNMNCAATISFGSRPVDSGGPIFGNIRAVKIYLRALSDSKLAQLTT